MLFAPEPVFETVGLVLLAVDFGVGFLVVVVFVFFFLRVSAGDFAVDFERFAVLVFFEILGAVVVVFLPDFFTVVVFLVFAFVEVDFFVGVFFVVFFVCDFDLSAEEDLVLDFFFTVDLVRVVLLS